VSIRKYKGDDNLQYTPHDHLCELQMTKPKWWKEYCPYNGVLSEDGHECDECEHLVIVEYEDREGTRIKNIVRL
jgi:hypothetical protein